MNIPEINKFEKAYRFLSNFYYHQIYYDDVWYKTNEHFYQAMKTTDPLERDMIANCKKPSEAKKAGRQVTLREDWEAIKIDVMKKAIELKFVPDTKLARKLMDTSPARLVEGNYWGDTFWGVDLKTGEGDNLLGLILMERREQLLRENDILVNSWNMWADEDKPWYCDKCDNLLSSMGYDSCDGEDPDMPVHEHVPHKKIMAKKPVTFEEYCNIITRWEKERD